MKSNERKARLLSLWLQRPESRRTENDLLIFYGDMERAFPHLLNRHGGDPYQKLKSELRGHIHEKKGA
jgi:hypothetical protein